MTNVDEKASVPERIFPRIISLADTIRMCVRRSCQSGETREHNTTGASLSVAFRTVTRGKGEKDPWQHTRSGVLFFLYVCIK